MRGIICPSRPLGSDCCSLLTCSLSSWLRLAPAGTLPVAAAPSALQLQPAHLQFLQLAQAGWQGGQAVVGCRQALQPRELPNASGQLREHVVVKQQDLRDGCCLPCEKSRNLACRAQAWAQAVCSIDHDSVPGRAQARHKPGHRSAACQAVA